MSKLNEIYAKEKVKLRLIDDTEVVGTAIDIFEATDDEGVELGFEMIAFEFQASDKIIMLQESDIKSFEELEIAARCIMEVFQRRMWREEI